MMDQQARAGGVLVTGASGALGRVVVRHLARQGWAVAALGRQATLGPIEGAAHRFGGVDLMDPAATAVVVQRAAEAMGGLRGLVNVAGAFEWSAFEAGDIRVWDRMYEANLRSTAVACQAALPYLLAAAASASAIVNVGAASAARGALGIAAYTASKAGVARLTEALADEFASRGLRVNAVLPTTLDTPANRAAMPDADPGQWVEPDALAEVVAFLLSDAARGVSGVCVPVAQGQGAARPGA